MGWNSMEKKNTFKKIPFRDGAEKHYTKSNGQSTRSKLQIQVGFLKTTTFGKNVCHTRGDFLSAKQKDTEIPVDFWKWLMEAEKNASWKINESLKRKINTVYEGIDNKVKYYNINTQFLLTP